MNKIVLAEGKHVYEEESTHLEKVENELDIRYQKAKKRYSLYLGEVKGSKVQNPEDLERANDFRDLIEPTRLEMESYLALKETPYFMRIDLDIEGEKIKKYYIGEKAVADGGNNYFVVYDWKEPFLYEARFAKNKNLLQKQNGKQLELYLRRAIDIKKGKIVQIKTEFDADALTLGGEVIDPFLLSVLKDKRRNKELTNIITTIQQNQSEIISKPVEANFVVQGCAGSGKTMILLHRLSYLLYNHKEYGADRYCILTPNEFFNLHIDDLCKELEIDRIRRFTVEQYYKKLIERMVVTASEDEISQTTKMEFVSEHILSEKTLHEGMLAEIYGQEFEAALTKAYNGVWESFFASFTPEIYTSLERITSKALPVIDSRDFEGYQKLYQYYDHLANLLRKHETDLIASQEGIESCTKSIEELQKRLDQANAQLPIIQDKIQAKIQKVLMSCEKDEKELSAEEGKLLDEVREAELQKDQVTIKLSNVFTEQERNMTDAELIEPSYVLEADSAYAFYVKSRCETELADIEQLELTAKKIPFYNFGKKAAIKKQILARLQDYQGKAGALLNAYKETANSDVLALQIKLRTLVEKIESGEKRLKEIEFGRNEIDLNIKKIKDAADRFNDASIALVEKLMKESALSFLRYDARKLIEVLRELETAQRSDAVQKKKLEEWRSVLDRCKQRNVDEAVRGELANLKCRLDSIDIDNVWLSVETVLKETYSKHGQIYCPNHNYRHKLYIALFLCYLYYGKTRGVEKFINVDEAQDIAVSEYRLLKNVLGKDTVFNLYGDVNQLIYSYKGVTDWGDLEGVVSLELCFLNENYRNTVQITEYCNKRFDAEIVAIGIGGERVKECSLKDAIDHIQRARKKAPETRVAILYKKGREDLAQAARGLLPGGTYALDAVENDKISIVSVETAKGLEFEKVVVISEDMTINEKYTAYTRALEELMVV